MSINDRDLRESAYCVEEFLRKVLSWEGCAEDELAEAIEEAEKLTGHFEALESVHAGQPES